MQQPPYTARARPDPPLTSRSKLRIAYLERETREHETIIADLKETLAINKQIIQDLCNGAQTSDESLKRTVVHLNEENQRLRGTAEGWKHQCNEARAKLLIMEQLVDELGVKSKEQTAEWHNLHSDLVDQLNLKEYHLQVCEQKLHDAEALIMKHIQKVPGAQELIRELRAPVARQVGISNVVFENSQLKQKLASAQADIAQLRSELSVSEARKAMRLLTTKIHVLSQEGNEQRQKLAAQTKMNQELYELNSKLSAQLSNLSKQVSILTHNQRICRAETLHTRFSMLLEKNSCMCICGWRKYLGRYC